MLLSRCEHLFYGTPPLSWIARVEYGGIYKGQPRLGDAGSGASMAGPSSSIHLAIAFSLRNPPSLSYFLFPLIILLSTYIADKAVKLACPVFRAQLLCDIKYSPKKDGHFSIHLSQSLELLGRLN